jgi:AAA+ superfamily predicted ATPase
MSAGFALFCARDHRDVIVRSWLRPLEGGENKNGTTVSARDLTEAGADPSSELLLTGRGFGPRLLDAETLAAERRRSRLRHVLARARFTPLAWYVHADEVPRRVRSHYGEFTFVYRDRRDGEIATLRALLPETLGPALAAFLRQQEHAEPIALLEGRGEIEHVAQEVLKTERAPSAPQALRRALDQPNTPHAQLPPEAIAEMVAGILTRAGITAFVERGGLGTSSEDGADALARFARHLAKRRPLIVIETVHTELAASIANVVSSLLTRTTHHDPAHPGMVGASPPRVTLLDGANPGLGFAEDDKSIEHRLRALAQSGAIGLIVVDSVTALPPVLRHHRDLELRLPDIVGPVREAVLTALFGVDARSSAADDSWSRYATILDFEKIAYAGMRGTEAVADLALRIKSRLERMGAAKGLRLSEIEGLGAAKDQARILLADLEAYLKGQIPWSEVDRGLLLVGPPGVGKTMLAKAISKEAGVRFIHASAAEWQASTHLGEHIQAIRNSFSLARRFSPAILFIDEFDSIGRRGSDTHNEFYHTAVVNCVLEELGGFEDRDGVMVIAATNRPDAVDPALKRAGRLDRTVEIHFPTIDALERIYRYYLDEQTRLGFALGTLNLKQLARLTFGQTGADVEVYVRGAARRARMRAGEGAATLIRQEDLVAEIMKSPVGGSGALRLSEREMRRVAVHEAGHALIQLTGPTRGANIAYLSIAPRADGTLGFVYSAPDERQTHTREELNEMVRVLLGGRAAEAVVFGERNVSSGAGGASPAADLAQATSLLRTMAAHYGFSRRGGLLWRAHDRLPEDVDEELRRALDRLYGETCRRMRRHHRLLRRIVSLLLARQEITGAELLKALGR